MIYNNNRIQKTILSGDCLLAKDILYYISIIIINKVVGMLNIKYRI